MLDSLSLFIFYVFDTTFGSFRLVTKFDLL
uniref:Uncharacterized protein n=1 Tax=Heterorhabditis bacteriophora TaxID=37862 RepID=A0A1I7W8M3_HETBA